MIREANGFGATVEEARENAVANLGASELDDIEFEIVSLPKKKVLGIFGGAKAEVRAFIEIADKKPQKTNKKPVAKKEKLQPNPEKKEADKAEKQVKVQAVTEEKTVSEYSEPVSADEIHANSNAGKAVAYIKTAIDAFGCKDISIKVATKENGARILLDGEDISVIIGRRGETLDALQYLASLAANNGGGHYKISLNIGNYRERREETLINLANRISAQVLKTGKNRTLEPMNPYERRIIHTAVQAIDGVVSTSFGEGNGRRVVISLEGAEVRPPRFNDRRRGGRSGQRNGSKRPAQAPISPEREPKKDSDIPLYGKIN